MSLVASTRFPHAFSDDVNSSLAGCRAGEKCKFLHPQQPPPTAAASSSSIEAATVEAKAVTMDQSTTAQASTPQLTASAVAKVVTRPVPQAQVKDPRAFQIGQIQRRYKAQLTELEDVSTVKFRLKPTDPDFPYDLDDLDCEMSVPKTYPGEGLPTLRVRNKDIPRGFQINIERGFDAIAASGRNTTLLTLTNRLDQRLETILSGKEAETVKLISNRDPRPTLTSRPKPIQEAVASSSQPTSGPSHEQTELAQKKRAAHTRQLEARFNKLTTFAKGGDGFSYIVPLDSPKRATWPAVLQSLHTARIIVPELYPLEPLELRLDHEDAAARAVERAFKQHAQQHQDDTITQQINYLGQHIRDMAVEDAVHLPTESAQVSQPTTRSMTSDLPQQELQDPADGEDSHIRHIPRPPEWDVVENADTSSDGTDSENDSFNPDESDEDEDEPSTAITDAAPAERGILLSFPQLDLHGIELLELTSLNLTVKCERCKDTMDVEKLRSTDQTAPMRELSCKKCAAGLAVRFRADLIHSQSVRGGYLDLDGCTVVDMLPSSFVPTCAECSTRLPDPGVVAVRGDAAMAICRECHQKLNFKIIEVKFLQVSASAGESSEGNLPYYLANHLKVRASRAPSKKKVCGVPALQSASISLRSLQPACWLLPTTALRSRSMLTMPYVR